MSVETDRARPLSLHDQMFDWKALVYGYPDRSMVLRYHKAHDVAEQSALDGHPHS